MNEVIDRNFVVEWAKRMDIYRNKCINNIMYGIITSTKEMVIA